MSFLFNIRTSRKLTQQQMADILCISRPTYKLWEDCSGKIPLSYLKRMTKAFDLTQIELLEIFGYVDEISVLSDITDLKKEIIIIKEMLLLKE